VTDEALLQLPKFPALTSLVLRSTLATNDGLKPLANMQCLEQLDLGSKWELNDAGRAQGQQQPGLQCSLGQALWCVVWDNRRPGTQPPCM
jgi:hypothetical protein